MTLLEILEDIHTKMQDPEEWVRHGICGLVDEYPEGDADDLHSLFRDWPKFSGQMLFPVTTGDMPMIELMFSSIQNVWDRENSQYAELRWELLEFMIEELKKE